MWYKELLISYIFIRSANIDDTIAMLNEKNKNQEPGQNQTMGNEDFAHISMISRDESIGEDSVINERPVSMQLNSIDFLFLIPS